MWTLYGRGGSVCRRCLRCRGDVAAWSVAATLGTARTLNDHPANGSSASSGGVNDYYIVVPVIAKKADAEG